MSKHRAIYGDGKPEHNPFQGELMKCVMCGREERSDPGVESEWRAIEWGDDLYYACPDEFPPDKYPSIVFELAYSKIFSAIARAEGQG